jgi:MFS family permease
MRTLTTRSTPTLIPPRIQAGPWVVLVVLTLGYFMILLDTSIVNVAIPAMEHGLPAAFDQILWVVNGYILVFAV